MDSAHRGRQRILLRNYAPRVLPVQCDPHQAHCHGCGMNECQKHAAGRQASILNALYVYNAQQPQKWCSLRVQQGLQKYPRKPLAADLLRSACRFQWLRAWCDTHSKVCMRIPGFTHTPDSNPNRRCRFQKHRNFPPATKVLYHTQSSMPAGHIGYNTAGHVTTSMQAAPMMCRHTRQSKRHASTNTAHPSAAS